MLNLRVFATCRCRLPMLPALFVAAATFSACHDSAGTDGAKVGDVLWRVEPGIQDAFEWFGIPAAADGRVFMDVGNSVKAFEAETGRELWSTVIRQHPAPDSHNLVTQGGLVIASDPRAIVALDQGSGVTRWRVTPNDSLIQSYGTADSRAFYTGTRGAFVYALDLSTGTELWKKDLRTDWIAGNVIGIAVSGDTLAVSGILRRDPTTLVPQAFLVTLDRRDGRELWRYESSTGGHGVYAAPAFTRELVLLPDVLQKALLALDRRTGTVRWIFPTDPDWGGPAGVPVVRDEIAYFGSHDGHVYAVDLKSGAQRWKARSSTSVDGVVMCGEYVFASFQGANIFNVVSGRKVREVVDGPDDFLTTQFVTLGNRVFGSGTVAVYALSCG